MSGILFVPCPNRQSLGVQDMETLPTAVMASRCVLLLISSHCDLVIPGGDK